MLVRPLWGHGIVGRPRLAILFALLVLGQSVNCPTADLAPKLIASTLIMGGTGQPMSIPPNTSEFVATHVDEVYRQFIGPSGLCVGGDAGCRAVAVYTPETLAPLLGDYTFEKSVRIGQELLDNCIRGAECVSTVVPFTSTTQRTLTDSSLVVLGESQSAVISAREKADLIARPALGKTVSFILLSNQGRPNGGVLERFVGAYIPILDIVFTGATPTDSSPTAPLTTVDIASQYDGWADFPNNPLNLLADLNAVMGMVFLHAAMHRFEGTRELQGQYQDTTYYLQPSRLLPILFPLSYIPILGSALAAVLDAPLRVLVETGYDRTINPGEPSPANFCYLPNPIKTIVDLAVAIPTGWDDAIAAITGNPANRPFRTAPQPVYGVGGPPVYRGAVDPYGPPVPASADAVAQQVIDGPSAVVEPSLHPSPPSVGQARLNGRQRISRQSGQKPDNFGVRRGIASGSSMRNG